MRKLMIGTAVAVALAVISTAAALAMSSNGGSGSVELGPFAGANVAVPGSCGNTWVIATFSTRYSVLANADGSYTVLQTADGRGVTQSGRSPQACGSGAAQGLVGADIGTTAHTIDLRTISGYAFNRAGHCTAPCFFAQFVPAFFPGATVTATQPISEFEDWRTRCNGNFLSSFGASFSDHHAAGDINGTRLLCR
jgi:hypothetical protein